MQQLASVRKAREIILLLNFKIYRPPEGRFLEVWERIIRREHDDDRGIFSGGSGCNPSEHNLKMDFANITDFVIGDMADAKWWCSIFIHNGGLKLLLS